MLTNVFSMRISLHLPRIIFSDFCTLKRNILFDIWISYSLMFSLLLDFTSFISWNLALIRCFVCIEYTHDQIEAFVQNFVYLNLWSTSRWPKDLCKFQRIHAQWTIFRNFEQTRVIVSVKRRDLFEISNFVNQTVLCTCWWTSTLYMTGHTQTLSDSFFLSLDVWVMINHPYHLHVENLSDRMVRSAQKQRTYTKTICIWVNSCSSMFWWLFQEHHTFIEIVFSIMFCKLYICTQVAKKNNNVLDDECFSS